MHVYLVLCSVAVVLCIDVLKKPSWITRERKRQEMLSSVHRQCECTDGCQMEG